jgi:hypothetical protein
VVSGWLRIGFPLYAQSAHTLLCLSDELAITVLIANRHSMQPANIKGAQKPLCVLFFEQALFVEEADVSPFLCSARSLSPLLHFFAFALPEKPLV